MMRIFLYLLRWHLVSVYACIKILHRRKDQVFFLSRQFDEIPFNYQALIDELEKRKIKYKVLCKKVSSGVNDTLRTQGNYANSTSFVKKLFGNLSSSLKYYFGLYRQMRLIATSKVIIVDGYNLPVSLLKHKKGTKVIQLWHALGAIKKFGYQTLGHKDGVSPMVAKILKMHANYDYVISGSEGMNPYFAEAFNVSPDKVLAIGTPTADYMRTKDEDKTRSIYERYPMMKEKINVLYTPTFRNDKRDHTKDLIASFDFSKANLLVALHPKDELTLDDDCIIKVNRKEFLVSDIIKTVDYVITDYSAIMLEAALAKKKILLYTYDYEKYSKDNGLNIDLKKEYPHLTYSNSDDLVKTIVNNTYDMKEYQKFTDKYVTKVDNSTRAIIDLIEECLKCA